MTREAYFEIALSLIPGIGSTTAQKIIDELGSPEAFFSLPIRKIERFPRFGKNAAEFLRNGKLSATIKNLIEHANSNNYQITTKSEASYPLLLSRHSYSPLVVYRNGSCDLNDGPVIAIVGTRKASLYGKNLIQEILTDLQVYDPIVVSGLAFGIDKHAHEVALDLNLRTVAVLASSVDKVYPTAHSYLGKQIVKNRGALLSEYPYFSPLDNAKFAARNRIIAALADLVLIVEAPIRSGALITAQFANDINTEVVAVPGNINQSNSEGCNWLIKNNLAHIYTGPQDIVQLAGWGGSSIKKSQKQYYKLSNYNTFEKSIIQVLHESGPMTKEEISIKTQINSDNLSVLLLGLEINSCIYNLPGNRISLAQTVMADYS